MSGILAIVPVRGAGVARGATAAAPAAGSTSPTAGAVPALAELAGRPLLWYALAAARESPADRVVVATADAAAAAYATAEGAGVVTLPAALTPSAPAEAVLAHALDALETEANYRPGLVVLIAPQTPLRRRGRVREALAILRRDRADSLLSVSAEPPLLWRPSPGGLVPFYDPQARPPRRGAPASWLHENGSLYVSRCAGLRRAGTRLFGKISVLEMTPEESARADDPAGLAVCGALLTHVRPDWAPQAQLAAAQIS